MTKVRKKKKREVNKYRKLVIYRRLVTTSYSYEQLGKILMEFRGKVVHDLEFSELRGIVLQSHRNRKVFGICWLGTERLFANFEHFHEWIEHKEKKFLSNTQWRRGQPTSTQAFQKLLRSHRLNLR